MNNVWTHRTLFGAFLTSAIVFLYQMSNLIGQLQDWSIIWNPPTVAKMLMAVVAAMIAFGSALGLSIPKMFKGDGQ